MDLDLFDQTLEYFLEVKLVRIYRFKVCLNSTTDSIVLIHFNSQLKICVNFVFLLCKQSCTFMAYDYVQTKNSQNKNYINEENNSYKFEKVKMHISLKHVLEKTNSITEIVATLQK